MYDSYPVAEEHVADLERATGAAIYVDRLATGTRISWRQTPSNSGGIAKHSYGVRVVNRAGVDGPVGLRGRVRRGERTGCRRRLCRDSYARVGAA